MRFRMPARGLGRTLAAPATAAALVLTAGLAGAGAAHAAPVPDGAFNWSGDQGDGWSDQARWYGTGQGDTFDATASADRNSVRVVINRPGDSWTAEFAAPAGQALAVGTYENAVKVPEMPGTALAAPSLFVNGYFGGCATLSGRFVITELEFGEDGLVKKFAAGYEQDCDDRSELLGSVQVSDVAPPKPMELGIAVNPTGKLVKGKATLSGTVTCTKPARLHVFGSVTQEQPAYVMGGYGVEVDCIPGKAIPWKAPVTVHTPEAGTPLVKGEAKVNANAMGKDPDTGTDEFGSSIVFVKLKP
ncbi:hypothetical protein [Streptomyces sp. ISL-86]|uniref:hypothetical protein n=1 Tax=Streptomyces sp. ISL-86 TaxID=2819187 RepID=UPI001BE68FC0|nr:hypothetical protein [Streptomyces sp. ISL-86]MBT2455623.1 hypothetical protein [Streptomyces sp. ISL-86]